MPADTTVKFFSSTMTGAPVMSGTAGTLINVLDACLIDGFGSVSVASLEVASNVATVTTSTAHNIPLFGTSGPVILIAGATPTALNGEWRVATAPSSTTLTFVTSGISDQTATGTITIKRAGAGWEKRHSGTNKAAYAKLASESTAMLLRVDDTPTLYPTLTMYETMPNDVDTGTGASTLGYTAKSNGVSALAKPWAVAADHRCLLFFSDPMSNVNWAAGFVFGDLVEYASYDDFGCLLLAHSGATATYHPLYSSETQLRQIARSYTQLGGSVTGFWSSFGLNNGNMGYSGTNGLNPITNGMHAWPVEYWEGPSGTTVGPRGLVPGFWNPMSKATSITHGTVYSNFAGLPERDLVVQTVGTAAYRGLLDVTGPWR